MGFKEIIYSRGAYKALKKIDSKNRDRIETKLRNFPKGGFKTLAGHTCMYRLRVGDLRVVFVSRSDKEVEVERIEPRGSVYKRL